MTAKRRVSLRKAQLASARKRKGRGRKTVRNVAIGGAVVAAGYAAYQNSSKTVYHHTTPKGLIGILGEQKIRAAEFSFNSDGNREAIYFTNKRKGGTKNAYGGSTVKITMKRKQARKVLRKSRYQPDRHNKYNVFSETHYWTTPGEIKGIKITQARKK